MKGQEARGRERRAPLAVGLLSLLLVSCTEQTPNVLDARGPGAERIEGLWWLMLWLATAVFVVIAGLVLYAVVRSRRVVDPRAPATWGDRFVAIGGVGIPFLILTAVYLVSLRDMDALSAPPSGRAELVIEVVANDWWWEAEYPNGAVTANEIHVPVGRPVQLELTTDDVIHSFWVPQLQPKIDVIPGRTNSLWLQADAPGRYRGQCAEYCGLQHANMGLYVVADPPEEFEEWMAREATDAAAPDDALEERGLEVFLGSTCVGCHAIRGTEAVADVGPDLTHVKSRTTLAAGTIPNSTDELRTWILDPQSIKPGATMPPTQLSGEDLDALVEYLQSLE